jgi:hypothetical protein
LLVGLLQDMDIDWEELFRLQDTVSEELEKSKIFLQVAQ